MQCDDVIIRITIYFRNPTLYSHLVPHDLQQAAAKQTGFAHLWGFDPGHAKGWSRGLSGVRETYRLSYQSQSEFWGVSRSGQRRNVTPLRKGIYESVVNI